MCKKFLSLLLAVMLIVSAMSVGFVSATAATTDGFTPEANKLYFDVDGTGWTMGAKDKVAFHIFGGDLTNGLAWGAKKAQGTATSGEEGVFEIDPAAKIGLTLNPGVQYKIIFTHVVSNNWTEQTYDLLFTTDCLGKIGYCDGSMIENPVDSSKSTLAAYWREMDPAVVGPVKQISSIGNVVGTCLAEGTTDESLFNDFLTVVDDTTGKTKYENAMQFTVDSGNKTEQQMLDDIGAGLGLTKQQMYDAIAASSVESAWDPDQSDLPGEVHTHTPGEVQIENDIPSTCKVAGTYDEVVYCTECGEELSRETKEHELADHTPGEAQIENDTPSTCKVAGTYDEVVYCTVCGDELSRETREHELADHTPGEAQIENDTPSTCKVAGTYDEVVYCTVCGDEISRETKDHALADHTPGEVQIENDTPSTCKVAGTYDEVVYCTACGDEISRETKNHALAAHTPGEPVIENDTPSTCTVAGTYDEVVYCSVCGDEISRETKDHELGAHTLKFKPGKKATETAEGWKSYFYCTECGKYFNNQNGDIELTWDQIVIPKLTPTEPPATEPEPTEPEPTEPEPTEPEPTEPQPDTSAIVAGNETSIFGTGWDANNVANAMFKDGDVYSKTYTVTAAKKDVQLKAVINGNWIGDETGNNVTFNLSGAGEFTVFCDGQKTWVEGDIVSFDDELIINSVTAVGNGAEDGSSWLNCQTWNQAAEVNHMTEADGVYTFRSTIGEYDTDETDTCDVQFKFAVNDEWTHNFGLAEGAAIENGVETAATYNGNNIMIDDLPEGTVINMTLDLTGFDFKTKTGAKMTISWEVPVDTVLGDINGDGEVDIVDVTFIQRILAGLKQVDEATKLLGDVDGDGDLTSIDATIIQRWLLGLEQERGIGA